MIVSFPLTGATDWIATTEHEDFFTPTRMHIYAVEKSRMLFNATTKKFTDSMTGKALTSIEYASGSLDLSYNVVLQFYLYGTTADPKLIVDSDGTFVPPPRTGYTFFFPFYCCR
jgi:hypothetical protein